MERRHEMKTAFESHSAGASKDTARVATGRTTKSGTTLAVIAGGTGRRMGGPKHALWMNGGSILSFILDRMCWQERTMLVVQAKGDRINGQERVDQVVADAVRGEGPLRGILTALECCMTESLLTVPIDMPGLEREQLSWLQQEGLNSPAQRVLLRRTVDGHSVVEPFPAFFRVSGTAPIREMLHRGGRALRELAELPDTSVIEVPECWGPQVWRNLNTPADASEAGAWLSMEQDANVKEPCP